MNVFSARHFIIGENGGILNEDGALWTLENCGFPLAFIDRNTTNPQRAVAEALGYVEDTLEDRLRLMGRTMELFMKHGDPAVPTPEKSTEPKDKLSVDDPFLFALTKGVLEGGAEGVVKELRHLVGAAHEPKNVEQMVIILQNHPIKREDALEQQRAVAALRSSFEALPSDYRAHLESIHAQGIINPLKPSGGRAVLNQQYIEFSPNALVDPTKLNSYTLEEATHLLDALYALLVPSCGETRFTNTAAWQNATAHTLSNPRSILILNSSNGDVDKIGTIEYEPEKRPLELLPDVTRLMAKGVKNFGDNTLLDNVPTGSELDRFMAHEFGDTYQQTRDFLTQIHMTAPEVKTRGGQIR